MSLLGSGAGGAELPRDRDDLDAGRVLGLSLSLWSLETGALKMGGDALI